MTTQHWRYIAPLTRRERAALSLARASVPAHPACTACGRPCEVDFADESYDDLFGPVYEFDPVSTCCEEPLRERLMSGKGLAELEEVVERMEGKG